MRTINIVFSIPRHQTIITKIIKWFQGTNFSHCAITYKSDYGQDLVYESKGLGEKIIAKANFIKDSQIVAEFVIKKDRTYSDEQFFNTVYKRIGSKYSYKQLFGYIWIVICKKLFNKEVKNPFSETETSTTCHEAVMIILRDVFNVETLSNINYDAKDLKWFFEFCKREEKLIRIL